MDTLLYLLVLQMVVIFAGLANVVALIADITIGGLILVLLCCGAPLAVPQKGKVSTRVAVH